MMTISQVRPPKNHKRTLQKCIGRKIPPRKKMMKNFQNNPVLGHITTFGGHPVNCAAALKTLEILNKNNIIHQITKKEKYQRN